MGHIIYKEFHGCFGHRVWNQNLEEAYADSTSCTCRNLHGHNFKVVVYLESDKLVNGMVTDFKHLSSFKKWLEVKRKNARDIGFPTPEAKEFSGKSCRDWVNNMILPYLDLKLLAKNIPQKVLY